MNSKSDSFFIGFFVPDAELNSYEKPLPNTRTCSDDAREIEFLYWAHASRDWIVSWPDIHGTRANADGLLVLLHEWSTAV